MKKSAKSQNKNNITDNVIKGMRQPKYCSESETALTPLSAQLLVPSLMLSSLHQSVHHIQPEQHNPICKTNESSKQSVGKLQVYFSPSSKIVKEVGRMHKSLKKQDTHSVNASKGLKAGNLKKVSELSSKFELFRIDNLSLSKSKEISDSYYCKNQTIKQHHKHKHKQRLHNKVKDESPELGFHKKSNNQARKINIKSSGSRNKNKSQPQIKVEGETDSDNFLKAIASTNSKIIRNTNQKVKTSISRNNLQHCESSNGYFGSTKRLLGSSLFSQHKYAPSEQSYTMRGLTPCTKLGPGIDTQHKLKNKGHLGLMQSIGRQNIEYGTRNHKEKQLLERLTCVLDCYQQLVLKYEKQKQDLLKEHKKLKQQMKTKTKTYDRAKDREMGAIQLYGQSQSLAKLSI